MFLITSYTYKRNLKSRLDVGSSKIKRFESPIKAIARESFLFEPPDNSLTKVF